MTLVETDRMIRAAIRAARKEGVREIEVKIGDAAMRFPLVSDMALGSNMAELDAWMAKRARPA
jgi:hypothetical protein